MPPRGRAASAGALGRIRTIIFRIPRGRVATYGQLAALAGYPRAARLTVRALYRGGSLPWHRVVAAGGRIALAGEEGREQRLRLEMEGVRFRGGRVRMEEFQWRPPARTPGRLRDGGLRIGSRPGRVGHAREQRT